MSADCASEACAKALLAVDAFDGFCADPTTHFIAANVITPARATLRHLNRRDPDTTLFTRISISVWQLNVSDMGENSPLGAEMIADKSPAAAIYLNVIKILMREA